MASPAGRLKAVTFRRKVFVGENHADAIKLAFAGMSDLTVSNVSDKIASGKEPLIFGYAYNDGSDFVETDSQEARKTMYGFEERY
jgi:hypothetical protein